MAVAAALVVAGPALGQGLEELRVRYPEVKWYDPHGRVLTVWGTPMTRGETPREAAEEWVFWHGDVFGSAGGLDLEESREVKLRRAPEGAERRVFMYRQTMDELPVVGSSFRVITEGDPDSGAAEVVYVAGRVATRPAGGLAEPRVTPAEALAAAKAHERGRGLEVWGEPELVAIYDDAPVGDGVAQAAWRVRGAGESLVEAYTFYVDALSGVVVRHHSSIAHFADEVQGTVTGYATPGTRPDVPIVGQGSVFHGCPNLPSSVHLADALVTAYLAGTTTLVDSDFTDESGVFSLGTTSEDVHVYAELKGPRWFVWDASQGWPGVPLKPLEYGNPVSPPATGVDLLFNPSPTEKETAMVNAHRVMSLVWRWLDLDENEVDDIAVLAHGSGSCGASYAPPRHFTGLDEAAIAFPQSSPACANAAYSTVIAHEYGHFIVEEFLGIAKLWEGFCDALAHLVFETEFAGEDFFGCDAHFRYPREPGLNHAWPVCETDIPPCSMGRTWSAIYCGGELLSALWLDMLDEFDSTETRELFLDWMMIAQFPPAEYCPNDPEGSPTLQAAGPNTLVEVLTAAGNNSPHIATICRVFGLRNIDHPPPTPNPCQESAGWFCYADCDGGSTLDFWDFLCFQSAFVAGDPYADCDGDGQFTFFDMLCFQNSFAAGCL